MAAIPVEYLIVRVADRADRHGKGPPQKLLHLLAVNTKLYPASSFEDPLPAEVALLLFQLWNVRLFVRFVEVGQVVKNQV